MNRRWLLGAAAVVLLAVGVHLPSLDNGFALDDVRDIRENEAVHGLDGLGRLLVTPYRTDIPPVRSPWRPVTSASFALSWALGDGSPTAFHAVNVALHAAAALGVLALLGMLGASPGWAAAGASVFAVHPVHVEAVANVVGRGDVLATLFVLAGVLVHLARGIPAGLRVLGVSVAYALALGAKEVAVVLPALLVVVEVFRPADEEAPGPLRRVAGAWPLWIALAGVLAAYLGARHAVLGTVVHEDVAPYIAMLPSGLRVGTAVANVTELARLLLVPWDLSAEYGPAVIVASGWGSARTWAGVGVAVGAAVLAVAGAVRSSRLPLAVLWIGVAAGVVSNLVIPIGVWIAERTLYLASVGVSLLVTGIGPPATRSLGDAGRRGLAAAGIAILALGGWRSWERSSTWADSETVLRTLAREHPESFRAQWWVAEEMVEAGDAEGALRWFRSARELNPNDASLALGHARALLIAGRAAEAEGVARRIPEGRVPYRALYLARALLDQGREGEARAVLRDGLARFPGHPALRAHAERMGSREGR